MLSVRTHLLYAFFNNAQEFLGLPTPFFCGNQDLRSLIVAMLQYSMPSVMTVLLKISKSSMLSKYCALNLEQWLWTLLQTPQAF